MSKDYCSSILYFELCRIYSGTVQAQEEEEGGAVVEDDIGKSMDGSRTDDEVVQR